MITRDNKHIDILTLNNTIKNNNIKSMMTHSKYVSATESVIRLLKIVKTHSKEVIEASRNRTFIKQMTRQLPTISSDHNLNNYPFKEFKVVRRHVQQKPEQPLNNLPAIQSRKKMLSIVKVKTQSRQCFEVKLNALRTNRNIPNEEAFDHQQPMKASKTEPNEERQLRKIQKSLMHQKLKKIVEQPKKTEGVSIALTSSAWEPEIESNSWQFSIEEALTPKRH